MRKAFIIFLILVSLLSLSGTPRPVVGGTVEEAVVSVEETVVQTVVPAKVFIRKQKAFAVRKEIPMQDIQLIEKTYEINEADAIALAQTAYGEYRLADTPLHKMYCAAVMWCCCWRSLLGTRAGYADTIVDVCAKPYHFLGYSPNNPVLPELLEMAEDVLVRFYRHQDGESLEAVGCVLPPDYLFFVGNGYVNTFRNQYVGGTIWDWSLPNPYEKGE